MQKELPYPFCRSNQNLFEEFIKKTYPNFDLRRKSENEYINTYTQCAFVGFIAGAEATIYMFEELEKYNAN